MRLNVVIIEDELPSLSRLKRQLNEISSDIAVIGEIRSVAEGRSKLPELSPDLIISDIELGDGLSFDLFREFPATCPVIFATAYNQYAIESFKVNAIDYLLKPIAVGDLKSALLRVEGKTAQAGKMKIDYDALAEAIARRENQKRRRFLIKVGTRYRTVESEEIAFAYTENKINYLVDKSGKHFAVDLNLEQLEKELDTARFFRINRSFIVGIDAIESMHQFSKGRVRLKTNPPASDDFLVVGTEKSPVFKKWLEGKTSGT